MLVEDTALEGVKIITPNRIGDDRGFFSEVYSEPTWRAAGLDFTFVQDNHSLSRQPGVLRGLHFQTAPFAQAKLIRCVRGAIFDVAVDIRRASPSFGRHVAVELSARNWKQLLVPVGFAHGFCTLEPDTEVAYKVSAPYSAADDRGLAFDDPGLGIAWPFAAAAITTSPRDRTWPTLSTLKDAFA